MNALSMLVPSPNWYEQHLAPSALTQMLVDWPHYPYRLIVACHHFLEKIVLVKVFASYGGVEYDDLAGAGKTDKIRDLILYFERRKQVSKLKAAIMQLRPDIDLTET